MSAAEHQQTIIEDAVRLALLQGQHQKAYEMLTDALVRFPRFAVAYFLLSRIAYDFKNHLKEVEMLQQAHQLQPENTFFTVYLARAHALNGNSTRANELLAQVNTDEIYSAEIYDVMGITYNRLCLYQQAATCFEKSIQQLDTNAGVFFNLASTLKFCGDFSGSRAAYEKAIAINPDYFKAHAALTSLGEITAEHNHIDRLRSLLSKAIQPEDSLCVAHALAKEYEVLNQWESAFDVLAAAKQKQSHQMKYHFSHDQLIFKKLIEVYSSSSYGVGEGYHHQRPLFVTGMPRTGTTLVERILTGHSEVAAGGELYNFSTLVKQLIGNRGNNFISSDIVERFHHVDLTSLGKAYIESTDYLASDKSFLVDKLPLNIIYAGLMLRALPAAKIVCLDRNPIDTIISNYRQLFSFHDSTFGYSLDLQDTARYYVEFRKLVDLFLALYPERFYCINYEALVTNPDIEVRKLLAFCGLSWQERCLLIEKNDKPVATASAVQVRKPITASGVGQWQRYKSRMMPAIEILNASGLISDQ